MLGAFLGLQFYKNMGMPFIVAFLLTVVIMFLLGLALEKFLIRLLLNKGATSIYIVLSTIGVSIILPNLAQAIWGSQTQQMPSIFSTTTVEIFGAHVQPESILVMVVGFAAMILLHLFMTKSRFGISMRAAAMDPLAASSLGKMCIRDRHRTPRVPERSVQSNRIGHPGRTRRSYTSVSYTHLLPWRQRPVFDRVPLGQQGQFVSRCV